MEETKGTKLAAPMAHWMDASLAGMKVGHSVGTLVALKAGMMAVSKVDLSVLRMADVWAVPLVDSRAVKKVFQLAAWKVAW